MWLAAQPPIMMHTLRENGPVVLVPLAWTFAIAAHNEYIGLQAVLIGHLVMDVILLGFTVLSWREMTEGTLRTWRRVLVVGFVLTLAATGGLLVDPIAEPVLAGVVVGWLVVPGLGLADTGRRVDIYPRVYVAGAALSGLGAVAYLAGVVTGAPTLVTGGLAIGGLGQTAGIVAAVVAY